MKKQKQFRCLHISDIHWRGLQRHEEYRAALEDFYTKAKDLNPNIICCTGDIVHTKTQGISPELIEVLTEWLANLSEIAPTYILLGNHDGLIHNSDRQDTISPIVAAMKNENIVLMKKSGLYKTNVVGYNFAVFSCFDKEGWGDVKPVDGEVNIALFHAPVGGAETDDGWKLEGEVDISFFDEYDFCFFGDIHKCQTLRRRTCEEMVTDSRFKKVRSLYGKENIRET